MHLQSNAPSILYLSNSVKTFPAKSSWPRKALRAVAPLTLAGKSSAACSAISLSEPKAVELLQACNDPRACDNFWSYQRTKIVKSAYGTMLEHLETE